MIKDKNDKLLDDVLKHVMFKYNYMNLDKVDVLKIIRACSYDINDKDINDLKNKLINKVNEYYNFVIYQSIIDGNYTYVDNYIKKRIVVRKSINSNISSIMGFVHFLEEINISIDNVELFNYLFSKNELINVCLEEVLNVKNISRSYLEKLSTDDAVLNFLEFYLSYNEIEILDDSNLDELINKYNSSGELELTDDIVSDFFRKIGKISLFTFEQERKYLYEYSVTKDPFIKNKIVEANLRLVARIAKSYMNRGVSFMDLVQEGCIGVMKAIDKFDIDKGFKFSTYASWWIRQAMGEAVSINGRTIRIPTHKVEALQVYKRQKEKYLSLYGKDPTELEMVQFTGKSLNDILLFEKLLVNPISTSVCIGENQESTLEEFIVDGGLTPEESIIEDDLKNSVKLVLDILPEREARILFYRFGIVDGIPHTLEQIGKIEGVSRERIRQLEQRALSKLKESPKTKILRDFY